MCGNCSRVSCITKKQFTLWRRSNKSRRWLPDDFPLTLILTSIVQLRPDLVHLDRKYTAGSQRAAATTSSAESVCHSAPLWHPGLRHTEPLQDGWHPILVTFSPRSPLQPMHMQLAADNDWMVLHVVWASMKETGSYRSGRQQGWLLTLRAVRRGSEPFSSSAFSARSWFVLEDWQEPTQNLKRTISSESKPRPRSRTLISLFSTRQSLLLCFGCLLLPLPFLPPLPVSSSSSFSFFFLFFFFFGDPLGWGSEGSEERGERPAQRLLGWSSTSSITKGSKTERKEEWWKKRVTISVNTYSGNYWQ